MDAARNIYAQTAVAAYAVRAKPGAPVATPLAWEELLDPELTPRRYTLRDVPDRLSERGDPWAGVRRAAAALPASTATKCRLGAPASRTRPEEIGRGVGGAVVVTPPPVTRY